MASIEKQYLKYPSINGLRALSICFVLISHFNLQFQIFDCFAGNKWLEIIANFLKDGHFGVNVFFVISGFLITGLLIDEEYLSGKISLKNFYLRRFFRIFPAFYFLLFVYFIFQLFGFLKIAPISWFTAITYTKYFNWQLDWYTAHLWSLSIEEHFYILWPLIFLFAKEKRKWIIVGIILLVPVVRTMLYFYPIKWMNESTIFTRMDAIATGCLFAFYKDQIINKIKGQWNLIFYFSISSLLLLRYFPNLLSYFYLDFIFIPLGLTYGTIANFLIAFVMIYSIFGPRGIWFRLLNLKWMNFIGILSYSIYLWQQPFISNTGCWMNKFPQNLSLILLCALFSYYIIEKPFLKLKNKFY